MKIIVNGNVYDTNVFPAVIVWDNDAERKASAAHIGAMDDLLPADDRPRFYASYPSGADGHAILDEAKTLYTKHTGIPITMTW